MTERDVECFYAVAKYMNFTEAAKHLYVSQQALSKQIAKLEAELGFPLFLRTNRKITLSPGGTVMFNGLDRIRSSYHKMLDKAKLAQEGKTGELRIGIQEGQNMDEHLLEQIRNFRCQYQQVALEVVCYPYRELLERLRENKIDIAICLCFDEGNLGDLCIQNISRMPSYVILANEHPLARALEDLSVLNTLPLLVVGSEIVPQGAQFVLAQCEKCNIHPARIRMIPSYSALYLHLSMGDGFSLMNQNMWFFNNELNFFPLPKELDVIRISCWQKGNRNPAVPLFLSTI